MHTFVTIFLFIYAIVITLMYLRATGKIKK